MRLYAIVMLTILALHGCAQPSQGKPAMTAAEHKAALAPAHPWKIPPTQVAILASEDRPAYSDVARTLSKQLGQRATVYYLTDSQLENLKTVDRFKDEEHMQLVSIGLSASVAAKSLTQKQVVFCQVFNYQDYELLTPKHKGVSMLPSLPHTFKAWRELSPRITDIGIISGPGFEDVIQTAQAAARIYGIQLHHEVVNSDKEFQYAYKKMSRIVQGYWLIPDNRVLSEHILRDIMTFSVRNSKQVVVYNEELLKLGGLMNISSNYQDIAQLVFERLEQAQGKDSIPGADIIYPDSLKLRINPVMARNLNIKIPEKYRKFANAL